MIIFHEAAAVNLGKSKKFRHDLVNCHFNDGSNAKLKRFILNRAGVKFDQSISKKAENIGFDLMAENLFL
jgi:hypothetical protein